MKQSSSLKWVWVGILIVIGILAVYVSVEYLTVSFHHLPSYIPGGHKGRGHYRKRGAAAALVALICFVIAGYLIFRIVRAGKTEATPKTEVAATPSTDQLLSSPQPEAGTAQDQ